MVPHSLVVASDRQFDLTLHVLTLLMVVAIALSLITLLTTALKPRAEPDRGDVGPPVWAAMPAGLIAPWQLQLSPLLPEVRARGLVFRCEHDGRTIYSDEPCTGALVRVIVPGSS